MMKKKKVNKETSLGAKVETMAVTVVAPSPLFDKKAEEYLRQAGTIEDMADVKNSEIKSRGRK